MRQGVSSNKGLTLTLTITAYDNGTINVDGRPIRSSRLDADGVSSYGWLRCSELVSGYPNSAAKWSNGKGLKTRRKRASLIPD